MALFNTYDNPFTTYESVKPLQSSISLLNADINNSKLDLLNLAVYNKTNSDTTSSKWYDNLSSSSSTDSTDNSTTSSTSSSSLNAAILPLLGMRYSFGSTGKNGGIDCSAFTLKVYSSLGKSVPRTAQAQYNASLKVNLGDAKVGDSIFLKGTYKKGVSHTGIIAGFDSSGNPIVAEASSSKGTSINTWNLNNPNSYHAKHFAGITRVAKQGMKFDTGGNLFTTYETTDVNNYVPRISYQTADISTPTLLTPTYNTSSDTPSKSSSKWYDNLYSNNDTSESTTDSTTSSTVGQAAGTTISDAMLLLRLKSEGTLNFKCKVYRKEFGENFVTGPYGMTEKWDANGNSLGKFKEGETVDPLTALTYAKNYYAKLAREWKSLLNGKQGLTQDKLDALVAASGGTSKSRHALLNYVLSHWGDDASISNYIRTFATTAAGNHKVMRGLVKSRKQQADWYNGIHKDKSSYTA